MMCQHFRSNKFIYVRTLENVLKIYTLQIFIGFGSIQCSWGRSHVVSTDIANVAVAQISCRAFGGNLLDLRNLGQNERLFVRDIVKETDHFTNGTVWTKENVDFSSFFSWEGCFKIYTYEERCNITETGGDDRNINIYNCDKYCKRNGTSWNYMGLNQNYCYFLKDIIGYPLYDSQCSSRCRDSTFAAESCGSDNAVAVYTYRNLKFSDVSHTITRRGEVQDGLSKKLMLPAGHQCVHYNNNPYPAFGLGSCTDTFFHGFLCEDALRTYMNSSLSDECINIGQLKACVYNSGLGLSDRTGWSWLDARTNCNFLNGRLVRRPMDYFSNSKSVFHSEERYWTGIFRTAKLSSVPLRNDMQLQNFDCVLWDTTNDKTLAQKCSRTHHYVCIQDNSTSASKQVSSIGNDSATVSFVFLALSLIFNLIFISLMIYKRICERKKNIQI